MSWSFGGIISKAGSFLGNMVSKTDEKLRTIGSGLGKAMSKTGSVISTVSGVLSDISTIAQTFVPELAPVSMGLSTLKDIGKTIKNIGDGENVYSALKTGVTELIKDEIKGSIPGVSTASAIQDLGANISYLTKRFSSNDIEI